MSLLTQSLRTELEPFARAVHILLTAKPYSSLFCFFERRVFGAQGGLELLSSNNPPAPALQIAIGRV